MPESSADVTSSIITQVNIDGENNNCYSITKKGEIHVIVINYNFYVTFK